MARIGIICFAASYGIALALELTRLWFRSGVRGAVMLAFAAAGLVAHTLFLGYRAAVVTGSPLSSEMDWYLLAAWVLVVIYLYLVFYYPRTPFGLVLLPLALGLIGAAGWWASREPYPRAPASRIWGAIHAGAILVGTVAVLVGFSAGVLYLLQAHRLKQRRSLLGRVWLPSLEWLERMNSRALGISVAALAIGLFAGVLLNVTHEQHHVPRLPWNDPLVLATIGMFGWLLVALVLTRWYRSADAVRKVAFITVVSFVFLLMALSAMLFMNTEHGGGRSTRPIGSSQLLLPSAPAHGQTCRESLGTRGTFLFLRAKSSARDGLWPVQEDSLVLAEYYPGGV